MEECPLTNRVIALEKSHENHERTIETICKNISRIADNTEKLAELIPLLTAAHGIRTVAIWCSPLALAAAGFWGAYWALEKLWVP